MKAISLAIDDFSCIRSGRLELAPVMVLIGPQGSGKSVTTKLLYFFLDTLVRQYSCAEKGLDLDEFKKDAARQFRIWFPPSAWGKGRFNINFTAGPFTVRALRRMSKGSVTDDVAVTFSDFFNSEYCELYDSFEAAKNGPTLDSSEPSLRRVMEATWRLRERTEQFLSKELEDNFINYQTFIPAGRAFFTSIGRLVAAIEQGSSLDPVTIRFAKLFANLRDHAGRRMMYGGGNGNREERQKRERVMTQLFGGRIKFENEMEFVETKDGRRVPFTALSSGQQELLPMWLLVDFFADRDVGPNRGGELFYIEEPEAHLFPAAQSLLMDFLIGSLVSKRARRSLILTTHSPYILAKLNNYLKAGRLGRIKRHASAVAEVVPRENWLTPSRVKAYALGDGSFTDLMDADGLIDASYIDGVSEDVSRTFNELLDIQYPDTAAT